MPEFYPVHKLLIQKDISAALKTPQSLGEHILIKRLSEGLLQKDVIKELKITNSTLSHWENNKTESFPVEKIPLIVTFLGYCPIEKFNNDGEKLSLFRKYAGLTLKQLGKKVGSDESYVSRWESMEYKIPYEKAEKLNKIFNTTFTNVAPAYNKKLPEKLETLGEHLRKVRLERGLSTRKVTKYFSIKSDSTYRAWESERSMEISAEYFPEIVAFLNYCPMETFQTQGQQLLLFRKYSGLTQRQLAEKLGTNDTAVMRWETEQKLIPLAYYKKLKEVLNLDLIMIQTCSKCSSI